MKKFLLALAFMLGLCGLAQAQTHVFNITWSIPPTTPTQSAPSSYTIFRAPGDCNQGGAFAALPTITNANQTSYQDTISNPPPGAISYCYKMFASNAFGASPFTASMTGTTASSGFPPGTPGNFTIGKVTQSTVQLSWNLPDNDAHATNNLFRHQKSPPRDDVITLAGLVTSDIDDGLRRNTEYTYAIQRCNSFGCSPFSPSASTKTLK